MAVGKSNFKLQYWPPKQDADELAQQRGFDIRLDPEQLTVSGLRELDPLTAVQR
jgi:hypothetical protein